MKMNDELFCASANWETHSNQPHDLKLRFKVSLFPHKENIVDVQSFHDQGDYKQMALSLDQVKQLRDKLTELINNADKITGWNIKQ